MLFLQVNIFPLRFAIEMMCFIDSPPSKARFITITSTLVGLSLLLALYVPHIGVVFGLMGSTASAFVCFVLPAAFVLHPACKLYPESWSCRKAAALGVVLCGVVVGLLSTITIILSLAKGST